MRRTALLLPLLLIPSATPIAAAEKDWTISIQGGASVPTGDFAAANKGDAQAGWQVGGTMDYLRSERWAFGVDGGWSQNAHGAEGAVFDLGGGDTRSVDKHRLTTWQFGAHAVCFLPTRATLRTKWYAQAGGGLYGLTEKVTETVAIGGTVTTTERATPDKRGGVMFGVGGTWWANTEVGLSAGFDYHVAFFDRDQSRTAALSYGVIHAGVTFIAPKSPTADF